MGYRNEISSVIQLRLQLDAELTVLYITNVNNDVQQSSLRRNQGHTSADVNAHYSQQNR